LSQPRVLVIEDDPDGCRSVAEAIRDLGYEVLVASTGAEGLRLFENEPADVVLTDLVLPDIGGQDVLTRILGMDDQTPVIIMTAYGTVSSAVQTVKAGAYDYLTKPLDLDALQTKVARAVETRKLRSEVAALRRSLRERNGIEAMIARSPQMREIVEQIRHLADTNATVHITGESGTGKELVARALHAESRRAQGPFVAVNCGAFTESLLESELFGHEKGAFTGAVARSKGAFERADCGTLFLDEVGDAPKPVQVKLLRVLEEREFFRVGGQEPIKVDTRVISASNRDLEDLVRKGEFREDLYYRLKVVTIRIPPLRERREDIRPLAERFVAAAGREHGRNIISVDPSFYEALERRDWPGNVRELRNAVEAAVLMCRGSRLGENDLRRDAGIADHVPASAAANMTMGEIERDALIRTLESCGWNRTVAARRLGISRRTIQRKIREYGLAVPGDPQSRSAGGER